MEGSCGEKGHVHGNHVKGGPSCKIHPMIYHEEFAAAPRTVPFLDPGFVAPNDEKIISRATIALAFRFAAVQMGDPRLPAGKSLR